MKNPIGLFQVPLKTFNHLDYLWAKDARQLVYARVLEIMRKSSEQAEARLTPDKLAEDYAKFKQRAAPATEMFFNQLRERQSQLMTVYGAIIQRLGPSYNYLYKHLQQVLLIILL